MKIPAKLTLKEILAVQARQLKKEHLELEKKIDALSFNGICNSLEIQRLKKKKLALKDKIAKIKNNITPDIIA